MSREVIWRTSNEKNRGELYDETRTVYLTEDAYSQFPYPIRKSRMLDVLRYIQVYQENIISARIRNYSSNTFNLNPHIKDVIVREIEFGYDPVRNNSHLERVPLKDKIFEKYQGVNFTFKFEVQFTFYRSLNYIKIKDSNFYEELCSEDFMRGMFHNAIFRSIMDSNIDDLF